MARQVDYSNNAHKYNNRKSFDGKPIEKSKVLVPFRITTEEDPDQVDLRPGEYIPNNLTTMHLGELKFLLGFMSIDEKMYENYMRDFWKNINKDLEKKSKGRCVIGTNSDGSDKLCPNTCCKNCPNKDKLRRVSLGKGDIISIDYEFDNAGFDIEDSRHPSVEKQVLDKIEPEPTMNEIWKATQKYFEQVNPRYAKILRLSKAKMDIDEICMEIGLRPSRGRQEIHNAHDALCDYLKLRYYKSKK